MAAHLGLPAMSAFAPLSGAKRTSAASGPARGPHIVGRATADRPSLRVWSAARDGQSTNYSKTWRIGRRRRCSAIRRSKQGNMFTQHTSSPSHFLRFWANLISRAYMSRNRRSSATARVHHAARQRDDAVATGGARAAKKQHKIASRSKQHQGHGFVWLIWPRANHSQSNSNNKCSPTRKKSNDIGANIRAELKKDNPFI